MSSRTIRDFEAKPNACLAVLCISTAKHDAKGSTRRWEANPGSIRGVHGGTILRDPLHRPSSEMHRLGTGRLRELKCVGWSV